MTALATMEPVSLDDQAPFPTEIPTDGGDPGDDNDQALPAAEPDDSDLPVEAGNEIRIEDAGQTEPRRNENPIEAARSGRPYRLTDLGNAERLAAWFGDEMKYCVQTRRWFFWDGRRWAKDTVGRVEANAKHAVREIYNEAEVVLDGALRQKIGKWAQSSESLGKLHAMIRLAESDPRIAADSGNFDKDPWLLNVQSGTVDLRSGELRPHCRGDLITKMASANLTDRPVSPAFSAFLARVFRTNPDLVPYVQRVFGYACTGSIREQVLFFLNGQGSNGKSTLLDAVCHVLGDYAGKADPKLILTTGASSHPTGVADLQGKRLVVCSETDLDRRFDEAKLKDLSGERHIKARFMRQDFFQFEATHKIFLYSNHRPEVRGTDHGLWRRIHLIPFVDTIDASEIDGSLPETLIAEADGILRWLVDGSTAWQRDGLAVPGIVRTSTADYRTEMDTIGRFLAECCRNEDKGMALAGDLYETYSSWCNDQGEKPQSQKRMGMALGERNYQRARHPSTGRTIWQGLKIVAGVQWDQWQN